MTDERRTTMTTATDPIADLNAARRNTWNTWVDTHAEMYPDGEALRYLGQTTTWKQLDERSRLFADALARRGVGKALFAATRLAAENADQQNIDATIGADNANGLAYYDAIGFQSYRTGDNTICKRFSIFSS